MHLVRQQAASWGLHSDRIGIMGFSAGGHLSAELTLAADAGSCPDFVAPIYGGIWENVVAPLDAPPLFTALASDNSIAVKPCVARYRRHHPTHSLKFGSSLLRQYQLLAKREIANFRSDHWR
jgi:acetyl esterase/lipase